jgi:imidazolonepropionase
MGKLQADLLVQQAAELVCVSGFSQQPAKGIDLSNAGIIPGGSLAVKAGKIVLVGTHEEVLEQIELTSDAEVIDARGRTVIPGLVDPHTHLVYAGSREHELTWKLEGVSYLEILERGGGILNTVSATRSASRQELLNQARVRADAMLSLGTTTIEAKSGYGLSTAHELLSLEVLADLASVHPIEIVPTFMGAHAFPTEYKENRAEYVELLCREMLPAVAAQGIAHYCDVFCEQGVFDVPSSRQILQCATKLGLKGKIHADELAASGGSRLAAELKLTSADHLLEIDEAGMEGLAANNVMGVLLPATSFNLARNHYAPARKMLDKGMALALATDCNPGSSPTESMQLVITLACLYLKLRPTEAIVAATINSAHALGLAHKIGSLEKGKQADIVILDAPNHSYLPYHFGSNLVNRVIKQGKTVVRR